jgi:hypothetical protein
MSVPAYRFTIFTPKSEDAAESTVLTPIAGAAHADPFRVTTIQGLAGSQPYMDFPRGPARCDRSAHEEADDGHPVDPRLRSADELRETRHAVDDRVPRRRGIGRLRLIGCKWQVEQSNDGGATWSTTVTGRVHDFSLD